MWVSIYHFPWIRPWEAVPQNGPLNPPTYAAHDGAYGPRKSEGGFFLPRQWSFLVPSIGGIYHFYTIYILPIG